MMSYLHDIIKKYFPYFILLSEVIVDINIVSEIAIAQNGVISRRQLLEKGINSSKIDSLIRNNWFRKVGSGIYLLPGSIPTWEQKAMIAVLNGGANARLSHESVLKLYGIIDFTNDTYYRRRRPEYTRNLLHVVNPRKEYRDKDFFFHRSKKILNIDHNHVHKGIPHVSLERCIVDCNQQLTNHELSYALDRLRTLDLINEQNMYFAFHSLHPGPGREKTRLKIALNDLFSKKSTKNVESFLEKRVENMLSKNCDYEILRQYDIRLSGNNCRIDFVIPELKIAIEVQSHQFHKYRLKFDSDLARIAELNMLGWEVIQFSAKMTDDQMAEYFLSTIAKCKKYQ